MKTKLFAIAMCFIAALNMSAQEVNKALVTGNADAAQKNADALKAADTGEKAWKFDGVISLNAAATGLVNWAAGGKNNVNGIATAKLHLLYHKDAIAWETNFNTEFGLTWLDQDEDAFQKSSDKIELITKFGWEFHKDFYLTVLGGFQSQYALGRNYRTGYNDPISKFLAPSYTDISLGIDYKHSVNGADFSVYLSPVAGRITTAYVSEAWNKKYTEEMYNGAADDAIAAGTYADRAAYDAAFGPYDYDEMVAGQTDFRHILQEKYGTYKFDADGNKDYRDFRAEFGLYFRGGIAYKYKDLTLGTTVALYTPYAWDKSEIDDPYFKYRDMNRRFGNFDVDWDVAISYQFLKVLNVTLSTSLKYYNGTLVADKHGNLAERVQFKSVLGLGIGYSF
ncbi:MAG: DUF3078 domain-containing protein [Paludibacteraceae bacterium]|nr:DUF3078 domain-containing protein [Paludibacteraceae bacterium]